MRKNRLQTLCLTIAMLVCLVPLIVVSCAGPQTVKPYEIGKVTAETILYEARVMQNKGVITAAKFDEVRKVYDQLATAQDIAIDARKALIASNTASTQAKAQQTTATVLALSGRLIDLARSMGIEVK